MCFHSFRMPLYFSVVFSLIVSTIDALSRHGTGNALTWGQHQLLTRNMTHEAGHSRKRRALVFPEGSVLDLSPSFQIPIEALSSGSK